MDETPRLHEALGRLRAVFEGTADAELTDTDIAELAGLDEEECRILLGVLRDTGVIEQRRSRVFVCRPSSRWTSATVRS
jgi:transcription initiation factor IIE alpha subunit